MPQKLVTHCQFSRFHTQSACPPATLKLTVIGQRRQNILVLQQVAIDRKISIFNTHLSNSNWRYLGFDYLSHHFEADFISLTDQKSQDIIHQRLAFLGSHNFYGKQSSCAHKPTTQVPILDTNTALSIQITARLHRTSLFSRLSNVPCSLCSSKR